MLKKTFRILEAWYCQVKAVFPFSKASTQTVGSFLKECHTEPTWECVWKGDYGVSPVLCPQLPF